MDGLTLYQHELKYWPCISLCCWSAVSRSWCRICWGEMSTRCLSSLSLKAWNKILRKWLLIGKTYITILRRVWIALRLERESSALFAVHAVFELDHFIRSEGWSAHSAWKYLIDIERDGYLGNLTSAHAQGSGLRNLLQIDRWSAS